ncbi:hypothetical protein DFP73DRAFT_36175 [Morchella snyderi]|nr:hypothetical protein DFP73DRAFT_36175 [Morchella snyderi]
MSPPNGNSNLPTTGTLKSLSRERPCVRCKTILHQQKMPTQDTTDPAKMVPINRALYVTRYTFEQILDFGRFRYHCFLDYNKSYNYCAENVCLRALYDALLAKSELRQRVSANSCVNLFMPTIRKDYAARMLMGPCSDEYDDLYTGARGPPIKLQVATTPRQLIGLEVTIHNSPRVYPAAGVSNAIKNTHPRVLTFEREEVELQKELERGLFTAVVAGRRCWVKTARFYLNSDSFRREVDATVRVPNQPTIQQLVGFVVVDRIGANKEGGEMIDGIVLRASKGRIRQLRSIPSCTEEEGWKWKCQIGGAVQLLHKVDIIWGRAIPDNIMIDRDGNALLIDFAGCLDGGTVKHDMDGLYAIFGFVDSIINKPVDNDTDGYSSEDEDELQGRSDEGNEYGDGKRSWERGDNENKLEVQGDMDVDEDEDDSYAYW